MASFVATEIITREGNRNVIYQLDQLFFYTNCFYYVLFLFHFLLFCRCYLFLIHDSNAFLFQAPKITSSGETPGVNIS